MNGLKAFAILALPATLALGISFASPGKQSPSAGVYTAEQANAGRATFQTTCAACHLADLQGSMDAPQLAGGNFVNAWRTRTTADLFSRIRYTMPANNPGSLSDQDALNLAAFILQSNGAPAGNTALTPDVKVPIGNIAKAASAGAQAAPSSPSPQAASDDGGAPRRATPPVVGVTVEGEVRDYRPVTDEMLLHPDPADWLMVRGNYQAWNHSALTQITPTMCDDLTAGVGLGDERGHRRQRAHPARSQRHHLSGEYRQHRAGPRRPHRRPHLGKSPAPAGPSRRRHRRHAQHRHLSGQNFRRHDRRAPDRARRPHRQNHLGHRHRRQLPRATATRAAPS